jgi:pilus assembly protein CpaF
LSNSTVRRLHQIVLDKAELGELDPDTRRRDLAQLVSEEVDPRDVTRVLQELVDRIEGFGILTPLMEDPHVSDIVINGPYEVWVDRGRELEKTDVAFDDREELLTLILRTVGAGGGRVDAAAPISDVRLEDGSRFHVVMPPVAPHGPLVSIRRFPQAPLALPDLELRGMLDAHQASALRDLVAARRTIVISGATGTGKTTLLNALLSEVPCEQRILTIEETPELRVHGAHVASLVVRRASVEGVKEIAQEDLLKAALRMRPDRIVVGEVRGGESLTALAAMSTGHAGSMVTVHAPSANQASQRLISLALQAPSTPSEAALRRLVEEAVNAWVHIERVDGKRTVVEISGT